MKVFEWDDLRIFLAILRGRSINAAAKLLGSSRSTVSRRLQAMEDQLAIKLFTRHPEGFVLTEVGEAMVARAERVESEILSMEREVFGRDAGLAGPIRLSMFPQVAQSLVMPYIAQFSALYPDIEIELDASFEKADLTRRGADIAIRFQKAPDAHLIGHKLPDFARAIYASQDYIDNHTFTGPNTNAMWVGWASKESVAFWNNDTPFSHCKIHHVVTEPTAHLQAVKCGLGFSDLLCFVAEKESGLVRIPGQGPVRTNPAWIVTHPDLVSTERVRVCVRFLHEAMCKHAAELTGAHIR